MGQALTDAVGNCSFQRVVVQDVFIDESRELGLATCHVLRFAADARPDRIDLVEAPCGPRLILSHGPTFSRRLSIPHIGLLSQFRSRQESLAKALCAWLMRVG